MALKLHRTVFVETGKSAQCETCGNQVEGPNEIYFFVDPNVTKEIEKFVGRMGRKIEGVSCCFECRRLCVAAHSIDEVKKYSRTLS